MQINKVSVSIVLDRRRIKANGKYPVKLRIFTSHPRKQKLYPTIFDFSESDFLSIWETVKPRTGHKEDRKKLSALETRANELVDKLKRFSFEGFESVFFKTTDSDYSEVFSLFDEFITQKLRLGAISTAEKYALSKKCIQAYLKHAGRKSDKLSIDSVDVSFLENLTFYCENIKGLSPATIGIYLRNMRCIYRIAIKKGSIGNENYPFLKDSFIIPSSKKVNKALTEKELEILWHTEPQNNKQAKAKDFWFFAYYAYGMNTKDICELKHGDIDGDSLYYVRAKTKTTKKERTIKQVPITSSMKQIIDRWGNNNSEYLFDVISANDSPQRRHDKIKLFNKSINKHFRAFASFAGINSNLANRLGTYHAKHSFATVAISKGASAALISEILHDGNLKVTQSYINSFPKEVFKELSNEMEL